MVRTSLRSSSSRRVGSALGQRNRSYQYVRLIQVGMRNTYYNVSDYLCPDFRITPTNESAALMGSLGLLFKDEGTGFSVLLDVSRKDDFFNFLRAQQQPAQTGIWTRLSFILTLENHYFFNFTDFPTNLNPGQRSYFLSNLNAVAGPHGTVSLDPTFFQGATPLPLTGSQLAVPIPKPDTTRVQVRGLSGEIVLCQPVYWPQSATLPPNCDGIYGIDVAGSPPKMIRRDPVYLDFSGLPEDKYTIEQVGPTDPSPGAEVIYAYSGPPLVFLDLLFTNPGVKGGVYPVENLDSSNPTLNPTQYMIGFNRRSTIWNYYIVSSSSPLTNLSIDTQSSVTFTGPKPVVLPGNQPASLFVSDSAIAIQQQSDSRFKLLGDAGGVVMKNGVLLEPLPVASIQQVIPGKSDFATSDPDKPPPTGSPPSKDCYSDIYVYV